MFQRCILRFIETELVDRADADDADLVALVGLMRDLILIIPIIRYKWKIDQLEQQLQMQQHITALDRVRAEVQKDPQFNEVQAAILDQIKSMPESIGRNLYLQLDQDPRAYIDMFQTVKQRLAKSQPQSKEQGTAPEPVKRETKAPILEQGNNAEIETAAQQKMNERIKELQRKSKNGDYRATGELMALLT